MAPPPAIFPNVITSPGSPPGHQPPVPHTIVQAFSKQHIANSKAAVTLGVCQHHHNVGTRHLPLVHVRMASKLKTMSDRGIIFDVNFRPAET